jgi:hypothetical protein
MLVPGFFALICSGVFFHGVYCDEFNVFSYMRFLDGGKWSWCLFIAMITC